MLKCSQTTFTLGARLSRTERAGGIAMLGRRDYISRFQYQNDEQYVEWVAVRYAVDKIPIGPRYAYGTILVSNK